jgi:hypothetical protein
VVEAGLGAASESRGVGKALLMNLGECDYLDIGLGFDVAAKEQPGAGVVSPPPGRSAGTADLKGQRSR